MLNLITMEPMQNSEGRTPFEDLTNTISGVIVYTNVHRCFRLDYLW